MGVWGPADYVFVRALFRRGLALVYLLAFLAAARQFRPLAGEGGLSPLESYVERVRFRERPSLFYLVPSDTAVGVAAWAGVGLSALALVGVTDWFGTAVSVTCWALLWALYLSFVNAGGRFFGFGWESMLLETGFLAVFLGASGVAPPEVVVWLLRWLLFRNMFGAGLIKLRGDDCWRDLTCLDYHYETQPMPNPLSWYAHHLPGPVHRAGVFTNHVVELAVPFLYFAPQPVATVAGLVTIGFQGWLMLTGNFSWLNFLTIVLGVSTFEDGVLAAVLPVEALTPAALLGEGIVPAVGPTPLALQYAAWGVAGLVVLLSLRPAWNLITPDQKMNFSYDPLHLVNTYGAFGSITRDRYELVVQGTREEPPTVDTEWRTYEFPGKPTDPSRRPPQVAPYHLRLDWQLWFAAMSPSPARHPWIYPLVAGLLDGDERLQALLHANPFPEEPPRYVRIVRYRYEFTPPDERAETGRWWTRERVGTYLHPVSATDPRLDQFR